MPGTQLTYPQISAFCNAEYSKQHKDMWHSFWPLESEGQACLYRKYAMNGICVLANPATPPAATVLDWTQTATVSTLVPMVDAIVAKDITQGTVPLSPITGLGVNFNDQLLLCKIQTELATGAYGSTPSQHFAQIQEWCAQANAA